MNALITLASEGSNGKWLPADINEVIWGTLAFLIIAFALVKFGGPFVKNGLKSRSQKVADRLGEASSAREAAEAERDRIKAALADSDSEAARIVEEARRAADQLGTDTETRTDQEIVTLRERATTDLAATRIQATADLSGELSRLALGAAEEVVAGSLDDAAQQRLIDEYISQVGSQN
ncbi:F0F1 ATP synthase subunit B [Dermatobacter hominis]|uniref:F0F1 ATP synthase subunit B n=1 Tax=Dermatobacter hominis TaxID=2884263 RepID=UPI001D104C31|nr:F0F1 ATP synthase subunit B [Dermatobacter hominis]UDY37204.1 F0F1 ATP synthase subunit B [Dermatobacter hominis]